jgi:hypothetical protein
VSMPYEPPPGDPTAVLGRRFAALAIDLVVLGIVGFILLGTAKHQIYYDAPNDACARLQNRGSSICVQSGGHLYVWSRGAYVRAVLLGVLAGFLDLVALQTLMGASIGKLFVGLRVIEVNGNEARFLRMVGRWLFLIVDLGCFLVGLITTFVTHPHRRVGDLVCGTYVVATSSVGLPVEVALYPAPAYGEPPVYAPGAYPAGWGGPPGWNAPPTVATPPGTAPTTPGAWGAVARPAPPLVRSPQWEAPPPSPQPEAPAEVPAEVRVDMAPQWKAPPGPKGAEPEPIADDGTEAEAGVEAPFEREVVPQWSPIVPLGNNSGTPLAAKVRTQPPPPAPASPWRPVAPSSGPPSPVPPAPTPPAPTEPPTEPPPPPPAASDDDDLPWWDAENDPAATDPP